MSKRWVLIGLHPLFFLALFPRLDRGTSGSCPKLVKSAPAKLKNRLVLLRNFSLALLLALVARPFLEQEDLDQSKFRLLTLVDFSGSMEVRDDRGREKRNEQIRSISGIFIFESWIAKQRQRYGKVEMFAFSEERERLLGDDWNIPQVVRKPRWVTLCPARFPRQKVSFG